MTRQKIFFGIIGIFLLCTAFISLNPGEPRKVTISGTVQRVRVYCGGAKMPEERYNELKKPKVYPNKKLFIKKGKFNNIKKKPLLEIVSDSAGNFSFMLPPGNYCIVDEYKKDKTNYTKLLKQYKTETKNYSAISISCLKEWFKTPDAQITVPAIGLDSVLITFHDKCAWNTIPCTTYRGPVAQ